MEQNLNLYIGEREDTTNYTSDEFVYVNSAGISVITEREFTVIREKGRVDYHLLYVAEGECVAYHNGKKHFLKTGDYVIYFPYEKQKYVHKKCKKVKTLWVYFTGSEIGKILNSLNVKSGVFKAVFPERIEKILIELNSCAFLRLPKYKTAAQGCLLNLLSVLSVGNNESAKYLPSIENALNYVSENLKNKITVQEVASVLALSESRFLHIFKEQTGMSFIKYVIGLKIEKAKELLLYSNMRVSEIALELGYIDSLYFSRLFKKNVGVSPQNYKNVYAEN